MNENILGNMVTTMMVRTAWRFHQPPEIIWPLLCNSRMQPAASCLFGLGLPQPMQCRLPDGDGGVGSTRQCISGRSTIEQTILVWEKPHRLAFSMDRSDLYFRSCVPSIVDDFELVPTPEGDIRRVSSRPARRLPAWPGSTNRPSRPPICWRLRWPRRTLACT